MVHPRELKNRPLLPKSAKRVACQADDVLRQPRLRILRYAHFHRLSSEEECWVEGDCVSVFLVLLLSMVVPEVPFAGFMKRDEHPFATKNYVTISVGMMLT